MTVRVNKSSFNIREKLSELGRKFGVKGSELAAAETVQEARDIVSAGRKNALYNGDMQIWQRGTVFANGGGGAVVNYTADRWNSTRYISSENDVSREDANHLGFRYCLRSARGGGDTATTARYVSQVLEQKDTWKLRGKYVTFSFYLRVGSGFNGGLVYSSITYHTDSSREERFHYDQFQNANNTRSKIAHKSPTTNWQRYTHTTYIPENAQQVGVALSSNEGLANAVSADYFEMTGCQLEVGRNATEFEHRSHGEELALCQRYFHGWNATSSTLRAETGIKVYDSEGNSSVNQTTTIGTGSVVDADDARIEFSFPVTMRTKPTATAGDLRLAVGSTLYNSTTTIQYNNSTTHHFSALIDNGGNMTAGQAAILIIKGNGYLYLDAEL